MTETRPYAIELKGITKTFGSVVANKDINLQLRHGEILSLLGENGSGKTTLMNMLSGIYKPDSGSIYVEGKQVTINSPEDAKKLGIGMVHQHFKLIESFTVADNIWIGKESESKKLKDKLSGVILKKSRYDEIDEICRKFGFDIDSRKKVSNMAVSEKQTLEIIKVLYYGAKVIILDEPTAVLTVQEIEKLFSVLRRMKEEGHSIIIITHKLNEVMEISDRVAVLRKGRFIGIDQIIRLEQYLIIDAINVRQRMMMPHQIHHALDHILIQSRAGKKGARNRLSLDLLMLAVGMAVLFAAERTGDVVDDGGNLGHQPVARRELLALSDDLSEGMNLHEVIDVVMAAVRIVDHLAQNFSDGHGTSLRFVFLDYSTPQSRLQARHFLLTNGANAL